MFNGNNKADIRVYSWGILRAKYFGVEGPVFKFSLPKFVSIIYTIQVTTNGTSKTFKVIKI